MNQQGVFPFVLPWRQPEHDPTAAVPPRVFAAMTFLRQLTEKTSATIAANDVGMEEYDGQELIVEEQAAQAAACGLLRDYFMGRMAPNEWEEMTLKHDHRGKGAIIHCPACGGGSHRVPGIVCPLCGGSKSLLVFPAHPGEHQ